jgi:hypothetical protein
MQALEAVLWVSSVCLGLRKSQTKTLADLGPRRCPSGG